MKNIILLLLITAAHITSAQKVANYSFGEPGTDKFEEFSFWVKANKRSEISYSYGKDWKTTKVAYLDKAVLNGQTCFRVRFTNNAIFYILPKGKELLVSDINGKYKKRFSWHYEGPVNGIGTFCEPCAEDESEAMKLIQQYYMKG